MTRIDPENAHTANVGAPDASQAPGDATLLERRSAALNRVAAENDRLRAAQSMWGDAMKSLNEWRERAEAAEAERDALRGGVEALAENAALTRECLDREATEADVRSRLAGAEARLAQAWDDGYAVADDDFTHSDYCGNRCQCKGIHGRTNPYRAAP